jgi:hypothetical protein
LNLKNTSALLSCARIHDFTIHHSRNQPFNSLLGKDMSQQSFSHSVIHCPQTRRQGASNPYKQFPDNNYLCIMIAVSTKKDIRKFSREELEEILTGMGEPKFRAKQIYEWLWQKGAHSFEVMTNLPRKLREQLEAHFAINAIVLDKEQRSAGRHDQIPFPAARRLHDRIGAHTRAGRKALHRLRILPGGLQPDLQILRHGPA